MLNLNIKIEGLCGVIESTILVGKLERQLNFKTSDLSRDHQAQIVAILADHLESLATSEVISLLAE